MRFLIAVVMFPIRLLAGSLEVALRLIGLIVGFAYRALGFFSGRAVVALAGIAIGIFLSRRRLPGLFTSRKR